MSLDDALKLDTVRLALREGDIAKASQYGRVYELTPVSAQSFPARRPASVSA